MGSGDPRIGLCARCRHARVIATPRSEFWLCERSKTDPAYPRYPRLPVASCPGHEARPAGEDVPGRPRA